MGEERGVGSGFLGGKGRGAFSRAGVQSETGRGEVAVGETRNLKWGGVKECKFLRGNEGDGRGRETVHNN